MKDTAELLEMLALPDTLSGQPQESEVEETEEERLFRAERLTMLGGTDSAAICGFTPYRTGWDVAAEKKCMLPQWRGNERTEIGRLLEEPVAQAFSKRTGKELVSPTKALRYPAPQSFLGGNPDRLVRDDQEGVEIKTVEFGFDKWSKPGEPMRVPKGYYVQCQHYMMITGYDLWYLVALFGLSRIRWYTIQRNDRVINALRDKDSEFWERYVIGDDLPPIEPSDRAREYLKITYPAPKTDDLVLATPEQRDAIHEWMAAKSKRERAEREEEKWKIHIQQAIGDATGILTDDTQITWKKNKDTTSLMTDWEQVSRDLAAAYSVDLGSFAAKYTSDLITRIGPRVLRAKEIK
jgi:putative phage-type endonuclease